MKISTKFRLDYLVLFLVLGSAGLLSVYVFDNAILIMVLGLPILLFGQLIIFARMSSAVCPSCGKNIMNGNTENSKYSLGYQIFILKTLFGRCNVCNSKL